MGKHFVRKMVVFMIAAAMILSSGAGVFATSSSQVGVVKSVKSVENYAKKSVKITWKAAKGASAYKVYKNGKLVKTVKGTSCTLTGIKAGSKYSISIAAVAKDGKTIGKKSAVKGMTYTKRWMKTITVKKAKAGKKKATIKWKKVKGATGYQVLYSKDKKTWKTKYVKGGSKTSTVIKKLKKGKWYYKVRAVKSGYLGGVCNVRSVKVK